MLKISLFLGLMICATARTADLCKIPPLSTLLHARLMSHSNHTFSIMRKQLAVDYLQSVMPEGQEYLPKIHGPIPYLLGHLRKLPNIDIANSSTLDNFVLSTTSSW